jgi:hypothetical protein
MKLIDQKVQGTLRVLGRTPGGVSEEEVVSEYQRLHPPTRRFRSLWGRVPSIKRSEVQAILGFLRGKGLLVCEDVPRQGLRTTYVKRYRLSQNGLQHLSTLKAR